MLLSSMTMLLSEVSIHHLKDVSPKLWNTPLESEEPCFYQVEIIGEMKSVMYSVHTNFLLNLSLFLSHLLSSVSVNFEGAKE